MKVLVIHRQCVQVCLVEEDGLTDEQVFEKAMKVEGSSQLTEPFVPTNMNGDSFIFDYECHEPTDEIIAQYFTKHEYTEALLDIEESKRVVDKPKRKYRKRKKKESERPL